MSDTTIFAWTEPTPPEGYPAYVNLKRADDGKCYITVRGRGNGGRDQACIEVSPQVLESLQCDLCEWLYRDDAPGVLESPATKGDFPYDRTFQAIAAAVKSQVKGVAVEVSVKAFIEAWNAYPTRGVTASPNDQSKEPKYDL